MADTENPSQSLPEGDRNAPNRGSGTVSIALSEENLAALLGSDASKPKPVPPVRPVEVHTTLAPLSAAQEKPVSEVPVPAAPVLPKRTETIDSTLALFAAIKESRAEALKTEAPSKPVAVGPEAVSAPAAERAMTKQAAPAPTAAPVTDATPRSKGTVFPASAGRPAQIPAFAAQPPAPPSGLASVLEKIPGGKKTVLVAGVVIAIGGVSAGLLTRSHQTAKPVPTIAAPLTTAAVNNFPLQLQTTPDSNGSINLRWNPQSTLIGQAREGRLVITENNQKPRTVGVSLDQLKFGHMTYQAQSERVEFRLEVVDRSGAVAEESILTLVPPSALKTAPSMPQQNPTSANVQTPAPAVTPAPATSPTTSPTAAPAEEAPKVARPAARPFTPPANQRPAAFGAIEAPPSLAGSIPALPAPALGAQVPSVAPPPAPAKAVSTPSPEQVQVADTIQAANLVKRVTPIYPAIAKAARIQGTVRFNAVISAGGVIRNLQVVSGPPQLRQAATDAVRQWVYRPMTRNGKPVEVVTQIDVTFTLN